MVWKWPVKKDGFCKESGKWWSLKTKYNHTFNIWHRCCAMLKCPCAKVLCFFKKTLTSFKTAKESGAENAKTDSPHPSFTLFMDKNADMHHSKCCDLILGIVLELNLNYTLIFRQLYLFHLICFPGTQTI